MTEDLHDQREQEFKNIKLAEAVKRLTVSHDWKLVIEAQLKQVELTSLLKKLATGSDSDKSLATNGLTAIGFLDHFLANIENRGALANGEIQAIDEQLSENTEE